MAAPNSEDEESLLCLETFISPTPPSEETDLNSHASSIVWINNYGQVTSLASTKSVYQPGSNGTVVPVKLTLQGFDGKGFLKDGKSLKQDSIALPNSQLLKQTLIEGISVTGEKYKVLVQKDINSNFQSKCASDSQKLVGNDGDTYQRMSGSNGFDRNRVTGSTAGGSNESLNRLTDGSSSQGQTRPQVATAEGMLMGRVGGVGAVAFHDPGTRSIVTGSVGAGPHSNIGGVFRPPQSLSDSARYGAAYSTTAGSSSVGPYSPLCTVSPYSAFYGQYPGYSLDRPGIGTYSAVLQSMGTQAQSHVPRSSFGSAASGAGSLSQYPLMTVNQGSPSVSSKGYVNISPGRDREELSYRRDQELELHRRHSTTGIVKDEAGHHFSVPSAYTEPARASVSSVLRVSPNHKRGEMSPGVQDFYKDPSGREGSLKYRLLRTSDTSSIRDPQHSAFSNTDEPLPKRTKLELSEPDRKESVDTKDTGPGTSGRSCASDAPGSSSGNGAELHYPQHFMKGSIIQLANGDIKRVEELETNDFVHSADISNDLKIDSSTVVHIEENPTQGTAVLGFVVGEHKVQVSTEATLEHPFFVFGQGWSSCQPTWTLHRYGLDCHKLSVGDVCISLTHKEVSQHAAEISEQQKQKQTDGNSIFQKSLKRESEKQDSSSLSQRSGSQSHSQSPGSYVAQGMGYSRSALGRNVDTNDPVKDDLASFSSSNQIPTTTKPQDPSNPKSSSS